MRRLFTAAFLPLLAICLPVAMTLAAPRIPAVAEPAMLIGLQTDEQRVVILEAKGGLHLVDAETLESPWRERYTGPTRVVLLGASDVRTVYRVQVGTFSDEAAATALANRLTEEVGEPAEVHHDSQRRMYRVRVGALPQRTGAAALAARMSAMGYEDAWVTRDSVGFADDATLRLVDQDFLEKTVGPRRLLAFAAGSGLVKVDGRRYRGNIEIFVDKGGRLRVVNHVNLEEYLRGVVPDEMGPNVFPQVEALKAQAVAARTYAARNRGQYADEGYDICDTPRCQVYGGADSEHPLSDEAIAGTRGLVLAHDGALANALFTSTCGGHTEHVENVFPEEASPYLRGVVCAPEREERDQVVNHVDGRRDLAFLSRSPELSRGAARLVIQGVVEAAFLDSQAMETTLDAAVWRTWLQRLAPLLGGRMPPEDDLKGPLSRGRMALDLVAVMGWEERLETLFATADAAVVLGLAPEHPLPGKVRAAGGPHLALLTRDGLVDPSATRGPPVWGDPVTGMEAVLVLGRFALRYADEPVRRVRVAEVKGRHLHTEDGQNLTVLQDAFLFAATGTGVVPVGRLALTRHEPVLIHQDSQGRVDYLESTRPFRSLGDDRFSTRHNWETQISRQELSDILGRGLDFGELIDLEVTRRGVSGRVAEMTIRGTRSEAVLRGFDVRVALRLMDTLFTVTRQRDGKGRVRSFVFAGKGWGHGVGMCQVGAFGMAVRGQNHRHILTHYYTDVELVLLQKRPDLMARGAAR